MTNIKNAPFTDNEVRILNIWQNNNCVHEYSCCGTALIPTNDGLKCTVCGTLQTWVHKFSLDEDVANYNPFNI